MDLNYLIVRNYNEKMLKKLLHLLKKILKFCSIECIEKILKSFDNQYLLNTIEKILKNIEKY